MGDAKKIIKALNETLAMEMGSYIQNVTQSMLLQGIESAYIRPIFDKMAQENLLHATLLRERIFFLGGEPTMEVGERKVSQNLKDVLEINLKQAKEVVEMYRKLLDMVPQEEGSKLFEVLEGILEAEYEDYETFQRFSGKV